MLRINQIKLTPGHSQKALEEKIRKALRLSKKEVFTYKIFKQSVDARKKPEIYYIYTVDVEISQEKRFLKGFKNVSQVQDVIYQLPKSGTAELSNRPVVAGAGPAGLFCTWLLAKAGYHPLLIERGAAVEERIQDVEEFWKTGVLNTASNVQFGEGGAGTFSDGKLNTVVKDKYGRNRFVLETFVRFGAPENILYEQKPHIGTDILMNVVRNMREEIKELGGEILFHTQLTDLVLEKSGDNMCLKGIVLNGKETVDTQLLVLAIGHSARDTFQMLYDHGIPMSAKSFAVGVRIEHPQKMIQEVQYGTEMADKLPAAAYKMTEQVSTGRGVYTFCMCPGGYVVNASSEEGLLAVNGMSYNGREGENANSAIIVTVTPDDYPQEHPLAGVLFQRELEKRAFEAGAGKIPVQCFGDFCENKATKEFGEVHPKMKGNYQMANVRPVFPEVLADSLEEGIKAMDKKIKGYARKDALISGVESRTSSPVKIHRDDHFESSFTGIYPCGEGAGYAGGITSAAMDGLKTAEAIIQKYTVLG
ncbi:MAG: FAD-dependent oxidoreductase [Ruminococcus sp.]|nr:FAD-dependent oxidoreductase [Ruminococcus sp.]